MSNLNNFLIKLKSIKNKINFNIIYLYREIINSTNILIHKNVENILIPNLLIKNIIYIDPNKIEYVNSIPVKFYKKSTQFIMDFNWEETNQTIGDYEKTNYKYIACNELFINKVDIKESKTFSYFKNKILNLKSFKNCKNEDDIILFLNEKINLFHKLKKNGFKKNFNDNLEFMIDSKNNLVKINSGNHRFIISKILKFKKIPVEIKIIHTNNIKNIIYKKNLIFEINKLIKEIEKKYA
tara:strand:- start:14344 stop:15060 length:717 start_codon:yes stop_codon:yes gene_type:complete